MRVENGKVASIHYTLKNDAGEVLDSSEGREPLAYLHGAGNIVPGLERELEGKDVGNSFDVRVDPEDGYGVRRGDAQAVERSAFPENVDLETGMMIQAQTEQGEIIPLWIVRIEDETVWLDQNHPLAGVALNFAVEVVAVRDATDEELDHGHPHGPDGHHHH
ncbi:MAG: peptidylprolyl isomerase [Myxococcales bacterium]|nr:peptidylprolyl isomerase [Myxococcales bacterium]